jgi:dihydropyrimidinase
MRFDCVIRNGIVVFPGRFTDYCDIGIENGKISGFFVRGSGASTERVIDASDMYVMPGVIDAHMHLGFTANIVEDFRQESACAALGGVTTFIAYILQKEPYSTNHSSLVRMGASNSLIDFGFHYTIVSNGQLNEIRNYVQDFGVSSFKYLMTSRGSESQRLGLEQVDDGFLLKFLGEMSNNRATPCVHCENIELYWALQPQVEGQSVKGLPAWNMSRPPYSEAEAIFRAAFLAEKAECHRIYIVHLSSQEGLEIIRWLRARNLTTKILVETCPHYLALDVDSEVGTIAKVNPPIRERSDVNVLWEAVRNGEIEVIASDHVARPKSTKEGGIWKASPGFPGVGTLLPLIMDEGYHKRRVSMERIAELISSTPAQLFGLYPQKGAMAVGSDADFVIINPDLEKKIGYIEVKSSSDYNIYEGRKVKGWPVLTMVRGNKVMENGKVVGQQGFGEFIPRHI